MVDQFKGDILQEKSGQADSTKPILSTKDLSVHYDHKIALDQVSLDIYPKSVFALIGPSGCGKSTLLRCFNRMNDFIDGFRVEGEVIYQDTNILSPDISPELLRQRIGMVFQKPNPFPGSIRKNITWGLSLQGKLGTGKGAATKSAEIVESTLKKVALWDEVKDRLYDSGLSLSGGQQQRLCIARAIAMQPEVILMDEPCASLDPISTAKIEELISDLKKSFTIVIVTHSMQQAQRVSSRTGFLYQGQLVECGDTKTVFGSPKADLTRDYVGGAFG